MLLSCGIALNRKQEGADVALTKGLSVLAPAASPVSGGTAVRGAEVVCGRLLVLTCSCPPAREGQGPAVPAWT